MRYKYENEKLTDADGRTYRPWDILPDGRVAAEEVAKQILDGKKTKYIILRVPQAVHRQALALSVLWDEPVIEIVQNAMRAGMPDIREELKND